MDSNWASDNLQTIRTLMERSAIYRRALAPIMLSSGVIGMAAAAVPCFKPISSNRAFAAFWIAVGFLALVVAYVLVRRQALRDQEPFWSPPTRRITQALLPSFIVGLVAGIHVAIAAPPLSVAPWFLSLAWVLLYGCALSAAGFFAQRGIGLMGKAFVLAGSGLLFLSNHLPSSSAESAHYVMGGLFGVTHFLYGVYLYFTERRRHT